MFFKIAISKSIINVWGSSVTGELCLLAKDIEYDNPQLGWTFA